MRPGRSTGSATTRYTSVHAMCRLAVHAMCRLVVHAVCRLAVHEMCRLAVHAMCRPAVRAVCRLAVHAVGRLEVDIFFVLIVILSVYRCTLYEGAGVTCGLLVHHRSLVNWEELVLC